MNCTNECRFCSITKGKRNFGKVDTPIIQNDNYMLLPSVGAMINGWTLVIPKEHGYSMRSYYNKKEFELFFNQSVNLIKNKYPNKRIFIFEHGANTFGSLTSCGTNHSHLHIIPSDFYILDDIKCIMEFEKIKLSQLESYVGNSEYLLYCEIDNFDLYNDLECYVHILTKPTSQFFRKVIANKLGIPEKYNYKTNMNLDIAEKTFEKLSEE